MKAGDSHYQDRVVRLHELIPDGGPPVIKGFTFDGCNIVGPAVISLRGRGNLSQCSFDGPPEAIFWQLVPEQNQLIGALVVEDCSFDRCRFQSVGFVDRNRELRSRFEGN